MWNSWFGIYNFDTSMPLFQCASEDASQSPKKVGSAHFSPVIKGLRILFPREASSLSFPDANYFAN